MKSPRSLRHLARHCGIQVTYRDVNGNPQSASNNALLKIVGELGAPLKSVRGAEKASQEARLRHWRRRLEPVIVAWEGALTVRLRVPEQRIGESFLLTINPEELLAESRSPGPVIHEGKLSQLTSVRSATVSGEVFRLLELKLPKKLPLGYHKLEITCGEETYESRILAAPKLAWQKLPVAHRHLWGVFVPLYALHSRQSWGGGDLSDLERLMDWVGQQGGDLVATLPLLAAQLDLMDDPSPYSPTSRLFWNEFYVDVAKVPEVRNSPAVKDLVETADFERMIADLRAAPHVDYRRQLGLQRRVLEGAATEYFRQYPDGSPELQDFLDSDPLAQTYARYRAVCEKRGQLWPYWPEPLRSGTITPADFDERAYRYHLFTQWQIHRQLNDVARRAKDNKLVWYLDFPLGVNSHGFDVWSHQQLFALGASGGAPPDAFFTKGQNWGFPPLHPQRIREDGYRYVIRTLRHHLRYAKLLRIDHVMGLYRLYWVPQGLDARDGAYVRYAIDELFAILSLESHRHQAVIIGENLGTVPAAVNSAMERHGIGDMYVVQYEVREGEHPPLRPPTAGSVASLNTHDMPSFTAFWTALDVDERVDLGLMNDKEASAERDRRARLRKQLAEYLVELGSLPAGTRDPQGIQRALMEHLGASDARVVFATLEDLWQEVEPQNTPGTFKERRNWQRKARHPIEEFVRLPEPERLLQALKAARERRNSRGETAH